MSNAVQIAIIAEAQQAAANIESVGTSADHMSAHVRDAGREVSTAADRIDEAGSKAAKGAGAFGDFGGAIAGIPGPIGKIGIGMTAVQPLIMGVAGAADLMTLAAESNALAWVKNAGAMVIQKGALIASTVATQAAAAAQWLMNAALSANPIGLIILAVVALVAVVVLMVKHWDTVKKFLLPLWDALKHGAEVVFNGIKAVISFVMEWVSKYIKAWITTLKAVWSGISYLWTHAGEVVNKVIGFFSGLGGKIIGFLKAIPASLLQAGKDIMNGLVKGIDAGMAWVKSKISGVANFLPGWLKSILGIHSRSTVFYNIGLNTMDALSGGIDHGAAFVTRSLSNVGRLMAGTGLDVPSITGTLTTRTPVAVGDTYHVTVQAGQGMIDTAETVSARVESMLDDRKRTRGYLAFQ